MIWITGEDAIHRLEGLVERFGSDYVYKADERGAWDSEEEELITCTYVEDGKPSCGVGHLLIEAGVPIDLLAKAPYNTEAVRSLAFSLEAEKVAYLTPEAKRVLGWFQTAQDRGETWGSALKSARQA